MMAADAADEKEFPFNKPEFFDQFEVGRTILKLNFVNRVIEPAWPKPSPGNPDKDYLATFETVGLYLGRDDGDTIKLQRNEIRNEIIPIKDIRGLHELASKEVREILWDLKESLSRSRLPSAIDAATHSDVITAFNAVRAIVNKYSVLVTRARMA